MYVCMYVCVRAIYITLCFVIIIIIIIIIYLERVCGLVKDIQCYQLIIVS